MSMALTFLTTQECENRSGFSYADEAQTYAKLNRCGNSQSEETPKLMKLSKCIKISTEASFLSKFICAKPAHINLDRYVESIEKNRPIQGEFFPIYLPLESAIYRQQKFARYFDKC